jgi:sterol desaturase/sphingolipid hydroxylase (fatty acid hydroxylase superfamily)
VTAETASALLDNWTEIVGTAVLALIAIELVWLGVRRRLNRTRLKSMGASYSTLPLTLLTQGLVFGAWLAASLWIWNNVTPWQLPINAVTIAIGFVAADLTYYWYHRWSHEINVLWATYHSVHHSAQTYDTAVGFRISFTDNILSGLFFIPPVLFGVHPLIAFASIGLGLTYQGLIHTEMVGKLGRFDRWFNSPSNHRVHHGTNPEYLDRNYGSVLMIWDRMFGTWEPEVAKPVYGLTTQLPSNNPITVHFYSLGELVGQLRRAPTWRAAAKHLFGRPGWQPTPQLNHRSN